MIRNISGLDILKVILGLFFVGAGLFYIIYPETLTLFPEYIIRILGLFFLLRGAFRVYQVIKSNLQDEV